MSGDDARGATAAAAAAAAGAGATTPASANPPSAIGCRTAKELVVLNVGGTLFTTTRTTLTTHGESMLAAMFRGDMADSKLTDAAGNPFIDRSPKHFPSILAYLRDGYVPLPEARRELLELQAEAKYFALAELTELLEEVIQEEEKEQAAVQARKDESEEASALIAREHAAALAGATTKLKAAKTALQTASDHVTALQVADREARLQWRALHEARVQPGFAARPAQEQRQNAEQLNQLAEQMHQLRGQLDGARLAREQAQQVVDHARSYKLACLGIHPPEPPPPLAGAAPRRRDREAFERAEGLARRLWQQEMQEQAQREEARRAAMGLPPHQPHPLLPQMHVPWGWQPARPERAAQQQAGAPAGGAAAVAAAAAPGPRLGLFGPAAGAPGAGPGAGHAGAPGAGAPAGGQRRARQEDAQAMERARRRVRRRAEHEDFDAQLRAQQEQLHVLLAQLAGRAEEQEEGDDVQVVEEQ